MVVYCCSHCDEGASWGVLWFLPVSSSMTWARTVPVLCAGVKGSSHIQPASTSAFVSYTTVVIGLKLALYVKAAAVRPKHLTSKAYFQYIP